MNEVFQFTEEESVKDISLDTLSQSLMIRDAKGQPPKNRPIQSWELIELIHEMCQKYNLNSEIKHIYVPRSGSNPIINREEKELYSKGDNIPIEKWLFNRVAFLIQIHHPDDTEMTTAIVGSFHDKGIQLAWGQHVHVCSNMTIFGSNSIYTFGEDRMPFEKMETILQAWIADFETKRAADLAIIDRMKNIIIMDSQIQGLMDAMVGRLYRNAVKGTYRQGNEAVFNMTQCSSFAQEMEERLAENHKRNLEAQENNQTVTNITLWDIYNWGTSILSPETTDVTSVYKTVTEWGNFLSDFMDFNIQLSAANIDDVEFFRNLSAEEEVDFRQWARDNFKSGDSISLVWHPVTQDECKKINAEYLAAHQEPMVKPNDLESFDENNIPPTDEEVK